MEGDGIARGQVNHRQGCSPIPMGRKDRGGNDPMGGLQAFPVLGVSRHPEDDTALL